MAKTKTKNFLPSVFQTETNEKFLNATLDNLVTEPNLKAINGFVGRKFTPEFTNYNDYIRESTIGRTNYQLEPAVVVKNQETGQVELHKSYQDILQDIQVSGGITTDPNKLFSTDYVSYYPEINLDTLANYSEYLWVPDGPALVEVNVATNINSIIGQTTANITVANNAINLTNGLKVKFTGNVDADYKNREYYVDGVGTSIILTPVTELTIGRVWQRSTFDPTDAFTYTANVTLNANENSDKIVIETTGLPDNVSVFFGLENVVAQNYSFEYPYRGGLNESTDNPTIFLQNQPIATTSVGIPFYGISNGWSLTVSGGAIKNIDPIFTQTQERDSYGGEKNSAGAYLYRDASPIIANAWGGTTGFSTGYTDATTGHSKIIGFAADGYPIYGPYGYSSAQDSTSSIARMTSSYVAVTNTEDRPQSQTVTVVLTDSSSTTRFLVESTTGLNPGMRLTAINGIAVAQTVVIVNNSQASVTNAPQWDGLQNQLELSVEYSTLSIESGDNLTFEYPIGSFIEDWGYQLGAGLLDEHNGRFCVTPEFPLGTYAYFTTIDASGNPQFPYVIGSSYYGSTQVESNQTLINPIYVTINRASQDRNPWSRRNRWFHREVLEIANTYSALPIDLSKYTKAKRPIIEFNRNLQLLDFGRRSIGQVDLVDSTITNAFAQVQNQEPPTIDGITVVEGMRIIFTAEIDEIVRRKVWQAEIVSGLVNLVEVQLVNSYDIVTVTNGRTEINQNYYLTTTLAWRKSSQGYQDQTSFPVFDVVDSNDVSFGDQNFYPTFDAETAYRGTQLFSYRVSTTTTDDPFLGFPVTYRNLNNLGDIEFVNDFEIDSFRYRIDTTNYTRAISSGFLVKNNGEDRTLVTIWRRAEDPGHQYQIISSVYDGENANFIVDIEEAYDGAEGNHKHFKIFVNFELIDETDYQVFTIGDKREIYISKTLTQNDKIDIVIFSNNTSRLGYYEIPENLEFNPLNQDFETITLGEMRSHVGHMAENNINVQGTFPGSTNIRDLDIVSVGGRIVKQTCPLTYASLFLAKNQFNFIDSINFAQREFVKFKNQIMTLAALSGESIISTSGGERAALDTILAEMVKSKSKRSAFFASDMIPWGNSDNYNRITYSVTDIEQRKYPITTIFNDQELSGRAVLVYVNGVQMVRGRDYTFNQSIPTIDFTDAVTFVAADTDNDSSTTIDIIEYSTTDGSYCPETPTKLGLFPATEPQIVTDSTFTPSKRFIRGHDGSLTVAFGDFRDDILLEFETRIYNNIKVVERDHLTDFYWNKPGKFRTTDYTRQEFNAVLSQGFYTWLRDNNIEDWTTNNLYQEYSLDAAGEPTQEFDPNRFFKYNYRSTTDLDGELLAGSWRACYDYYYDTTTPQLTPWEMLGFTAEPAWWQSEYGSAPYTAGNQLLWQDLEEGRIRQGARAGINLLFARTGLSQYIPVDDQGNLIAPANLMAQDRIDVDSSWQFGNWSPIEWAWRRSAEFRFAWQIAIALTQPAKYFTYGSNTKDYAFNSDLDQFIVTSTNKQLQKTDLKINTSTARSAGYLNWIAAKLMNDGIADITIVEDYINNHTVRLSYRLAGFSDKKRLKMVAQQYSPQSKTQGVLIPDEDYDLYLNESAPILDAVYSAITIERVVDGYKVSGYNPHAPYFLVVNPNYRGKNSPIKVINEQVTYYEEFLQNVNVVNYNTIFRTPQQVTNFIVAYQRYLETIGFDFDDQEPYLGATKNWQLSIKEFIYWVQQGWSSGSIITLSPVGHSLKFSSPVGVVAELDNTSDGYRIQNQNKVILNKNQYTVNRQGNEFRISATDRIQNAISFARLKIVQNEHVVIFENETDFKDVIYNPVFGQRQYKIKIVGKKTANWSGSISPEGFIVNQSNIESWNSNTDYKRGTLVEFKNFYYVAKDDIIGDVNFDYSEWKPVSQDNFKFGLLPNFSTIAGQSRYYFDVDRINFESEFDQLALGLIGYRNRNYFQNAGFDDNTQVKLYQGIIKQKGTKNAINSVTKVLGNTDIEEEWAFRVGEYGALDQKDYIEIGLSESNIKGNPSTLILENEKITYPNGVSDSLGIINYGAAEIPSQLFSEETSLVDVENRLKTAGFVNYNDVDWTTYSFAPSDINFTIEDLKTGQTVWVAVDYYADWNVFRVINAKNKITKISNLFDSTLLIDTERSNNIEKDFVVAVKTGDELQGFYRVIEVFNNKQFSVQYTGTENLANFVSRDYTNVVMTYLLSVKTNYPADIIETTPATGWMDGDRVWVKNTNTKKWQVFEKNNPLSTLGKINSPEPINLGKMGFMFDVSEDKKSLVVKPNESANPKVLYHYRNTNTGYEIYENINLPTFTVGITDILEIKLKTNLMFIRCSTDTNRNILLIYEKVGERFNLQQVILQAIFNDAQKMAISKDENWMFLDSKDISNNKVIQNYEFVRISPRVYATEIDYNNQIYLLDEDIDIDFVEVKTDTYNLLLNLDYSFRTNIDGRIVIELYRPYTTGTTLYVITNSKFILKSTLTLGVSDSIKSMSCDAAGKNLVVTFYSSSRNIVVYSRYIEKFVYNNESELTLNETFTEFTKVYYGSILKTLNVDYSVNNNNITFINKPDVGNIVTVFFNNLKLTQTLATDFINNDFDFSSQLEISQDGNYIYASSPDYSDGELYRVGIVERWVNYSSIVKSYISNTIDGFAGGLYTLKINDFYVGTFGGNDTASTVLNAIESKNIPGITATIVETNKLKITIDEEIETSLNIASNSVGSEVFPQFVKIDNIKNPTSTPYDRFGHSILINETSDVVLIGSPYAFAILETTFDRFTDIIDVQQQTTFDGNTTEFKDLLQSGCIWSFTNLQDSLESSQKIAKLGYVNQIFPSSFSEYKSGILRFSRYAVMKNNLLIVGAPTTSIGSIDGFNHGQLFFGNITGKGWDVIRQSGNLVDLKSIERLFVYSKQSNQILYGLDFIDPNKGKILGIAEQDIRYKTDYDPATYETDSFVWNADQVGEVWWDLSTVRFVDYEQDSYEYRASNWAKYFVGSSIDVYEWVESNFPPSLYIENNGDGVPYLNGSTPFTTVETIDEYTGIVIVKYYFWVKDKTTTPNDVKNRRLPVSTIAQYIDNPVSSGIKFLAPIAKNAVALYNVFGDLVSNDRVLHIDYKFDTINDNVFGEFKIVSDKSINTSQLPTTIVDKLADSIGGLDANNNLVPDINLVPAKRLGIDFKPRQTVFINRLTAARTLVDYCNNVFANYKISKRFNVDTLLFGEASPDSGIVFTDELLYELKVKTYLELSYINRTITEIGYRVLVTSDETIEGLWAIYELNSNREWSRIRCQSWSTQEYWNYRDWYADGYDSRTVPDYTFEDYNDFNRRAIYQITGFTIASGGSNYTVAGTSISLSGGGAITQTIIGTQTIANDGTTTIEVGTPTIENGRIVGIDIINTGSGYIDQPRITINGDGSGAIITPVIGTQSGLIIKIRDDGTGKWNLIKTTETDYDIIAIEDGTLELKSALWDYENNEIGFDNDVFDGSRFDKNPQKETRELFNTLRNTVFSGELEKEFVGLFFSLIKYAFIEQLSIDWAFKSSFIKVNHTVGELNQRKFYSPSNSNMVRGYIDEVKPYHTMVREFVEQHDKIDTINSTTTDFDIAPYYDNTLSLFRSPQYQEFYSNGSPKFLQTYPHDISAFDNQRYDFWRENFAYRIHEVEIINGGSGFTENSTFTETIVNNNGDNGLVRFTVGTTGSIVLAEVIDRGSGFIQSPVITLENGALVHVHLMNDLIRKFKTTIKYDRVSYGKEPTLWLPNKNYKQFDIINYIDANYARSLSATIIGTDIEVVEATGYDVSAFDYFAFDADEKDVFIPARAWIATRDFNSGNTFRPTIFVNTVSGVVERTIMQPYANYVSIRVWQPNTEYYLDQIVVYRSIPYLVTARFTTGQSFVGNNLDKDLAKVVLTQPANDNASNRILVYYDPVTGRPGRDLSQLMTGIDYSGVIVQGIGFEAGGGYDVAPFDLYPFDLISTDESGNQIFAEEEMDAIVGDTDYLDNSNDIDYIVDGDEFITPEYTHAPEELLPGRVYDTMDMKIVTLSTDATDATYITWINGDAYTLSGFFGNGGANIASANITVTGYKVDGDYWTEPNLGISYNGAVISNIVAPIVDNSIDIANITLSNTGWIYVSNVSVDAVAVTDTTLVQPKLWANLTQTFESNRFNYHIWKDMNDNNQYLATNVGNTTTLVSNLEANLSYANIVVTDSTLLPTPTILLTESNVVAESLNARLDVNSVNYINVTLFNSTTNSNVRWGMISNAVSEIYGNVELYRRSDASVALGIYPKPGVIMINGERMEYWGKFDSNNTLSRVRRGTAGTSVLEHYADEKVYDFTRNVAGSSFTNWTPTIDVIIPTQTEDIYLNFDDITTESGDTITTESSLLLATDGVFTSGIQSYTFESGETYIRTQIFNVPGWDMMVTEDGDLLVLDGSLDTGIYIEPPAFITDERGLYNSGNSSSDDYTISAEFVVNSLYEE